MLKLKKWYRIPATVGWILCFILYSSAGRIFIRKGKKRLRFHVHTTSFFTRNILKLMDIRVEINGKSGENRVSLDRNYLILSNHLSYFDILILSSLFPAVFVSSVEMQKTFFLGDLAMLGGTVFVERRSSSGIKQEISRLAGVLKEGFSIVLFPEGTTSNGDRILPFKKSLMACAVEADIPVLPVCLKYQNLNGEAVNPENRDFIYWYGEMSFFPHFIRFLKQVNHLTVSLNLLEEIPVEKEEPSLARKKMASAAFHQIQQAYQS